MSIELICVDADDTLWHCESQFRLTQARFADLLRGHADDAMIGDRLATIERRNLAVYGYGAKGFTLSMIETAVELAGDDLPVAAIAEILAYGRAMLSHPVEPIEGVEEALTALAGRGRLVLVTKGDLFHQEAKLASSGLGALFAGVEIVSEKDADCYARVFARHGASPRQAVMAGNSVKSDVLPVLESGGHAALIPYHLVWSHEAALAPTGHPRFRELATLSELAGWIDTIA
jgi:putative hydrolase of the HAD superfamily